MTHAALGSFHETRREGPSRAVAARAGARWAGHRRLLVSGLVIAVAGCQAPPPASDPLRASQEANRRLFGDFELPRRLGFVENIGLQLPAVSPDGEQLVFLRTDQEHLSPLTLLGSGAPEETPPQGTLSLWLRPLRGSSPGRRISQPRWSHSPTWSDSGDHIAFVSNEPPGSSIRLLNLQTGVTQTLGVPRAINIMPRFAGDDATLLFAAGPSPDEPCRIYRQTAGEAPVPLSPEGSDCVLPARLEPDGSVICALLQGFELAWVRARPDRIEPLVDRAGDGGRPALLQTWAGISGPVSPDGLSLLFYDGLQDRIGVFHTNEQVVRRHRSGSMAACWLSPDAIALATADGLFAVDTATVVSHPLLSGAWVPLRFIPLRRELILLGREGSGARFSIVSLAFRTQDRSPS